MKVSYTASCSEEQGAVEMRTRLVEMHGKDT